LARNSLPAAGPILGSYAAKTCARAINNQFDVTVIAPPYETPPDLQRLFDSGIDHEAAVFEAWAAARPDVVNLLSLDCDKAAHIAATVEALTNGADVILGGRLPDDLIGGRGGKPDILLRDPRGGGYHPADVKAHRALTAGEGARVSNLAQPLFAESTPVELAVRHREVDLIQLSHYWRMLQSCGFSAAAPYGAIVGNDPGDEYLLTWYDLSSPIFKTFSRSNGKTSRSALERHDHEHAFRVKVAARAMERTGAADDPPPLVEPFGQEECEACAWAPVCIDVLPAGDLSRELRGTLSVREYLALRDQGIATVDQLAGADLDALLTTEYADDTTNVHGRAARLRKAQIAAELTRDGDVLRIKPDAVVDLPETAVEIDIDMESTRDGRVYLWGLLVTTGGTSEYVAFADPGVCDDESEIAVAKGCFDWIVANHPAASVYHYSHVEQHHARRILGGDLARYDGTASSPDGWIDLLPVVRNCLESRSGLGLKVIATEAASFHWRDDNPGGLQSQLWLEQAQSGDDEAWQRILAYNEDDVRATLAVRRFLRAECS
jgi:predicted RecB family nuclease